MDEIYQESENQLKKSRKRKFDEIVGDGEKYEKHETYEKYIIPDKKRLLLKSPLGRIFLTGQFLPEISQSWH